MCFSISGGVYDLTSGVHIELATSFQSVSVSFIQLSLLHPIYRTYLIALSFLFINFRFLRYINFPALSVRSSTDSSLLFIAVVLILPHSNLTMLIH